MELREALRNSVGIIVDTIKQAVDETPPELVADLMEHGIALAGGGAMLKGLAQRLTEETKMKVYVAEDPLSCVARGAGKVLEDFDDTPEDPGQHAARQHAALIAETQRLRNGDHGKSVVPISLCLTLSLRHPRRGYEAHLWAARSSSSSWLPSAWCC